MVGEGVCGQNSCYHAAAFRDSRVFDKQLDHVLKKLNFDLWTLWGEVGVCVQNVCYHVAAFVIPFYLICNMILF